MITSGVPLAENKQVSLELTPFIAKAMASRFEIRQELDRILAEGWLPEQYDADEKKQAFACYFRESDPVTEYYCHKAAALLYGLDCPGEVNARATRELELIIREYWRNLYLYVINSESPVIFDPYYQKYVLNHMEPANAITTKNLQSILPMQVSLAQGQQTKKGSRNKHKKAKPLIAQRDMLDGQLCIFLFTAAMMGKQVDQNTFWHHAIFKMYFIKQMRLSRSEVLVLNEQQQQLSEALWQAVDQRLKGIPANLKDLKGTIAGRELKYWFFEDNWDGLPLDSLVEIKITRKELNNALTEMIAVLPAGTAVTPGLVKEVITLFAHTMFVKGCAVEYGKLRQKLAQELAAKQQDKPKASAREMNRRLNEAEESARTLEKEKNNLQNAAQEWERKLEKSERLREQQVAATEEKLYAAQAAYQGLLASAAEEENPPEMADELSAATMAKILALRVVVIGGRMDWQQRLKARFPHFRFIASTEIKYDLAVLEQADVIVICWKNMGHDIFDRTIFYIGRENEKIAYLANTNEQIFLRLLKKYMK